MVTKELQKKALDLKPIDRIHFVETILESLDELDLEIEKAWVAESEARYAAYKNGNLKTISYKTIKKRLRK